MLPIPAWLNFWIFFFIKSIIIQSLFFEQSFAGFDEDSAGFDEDSAGFGQGSANYLGSDRILRGSWPHGPPPLGWVNVLTRYDQFPPLILHSAHTADQNTRPSLCFYQYLG